MTKILADEYDGEFSEWTNGWQEINDSETQAYLVQELAREIRKNKKHVLFGQTVRFVACNPQSDDFVIVLGSSNEYAYIHLTYNEESSPDYPHTELLGDSESLRRFLRK